MMTGGGQLAIHAPKQQQHAQQEPRQQRWLPLCWGIENKGVWRENIGLGGTPMIT